MRRIRTASSIWLGSATARAFGTGQRLQQLRGNLVLNAVKYGARDAPVGVSLTGEEAEVVLEEKNSGAAIERSTLDRIFDPLHTAPERRLSVPPSQRHGRYRRPFHCYRFHRRFAPKPRSTLPQEHC